MWKQLVLAAALTAALAAAAAPKAATAPLACPKQCQCADERPQECPQQRSLVARPDCFQCCVVCARVAGEECGGSPEAVCDAHLHCVDNKCKELPRLLWPSSEPIEILHVAPINSDGVEIFIRIPDGAAEVAKSIEIQQYAVPTSPRNRVKITRKSPAWDERTFVVQVEGLKWKELYLTVVAGEFRSPGFKVNLNEKLPTMRKLLFAEPDEEETNKPEATPCMYEGKAFNPGEAYLSTNCSERCECDGKGIFKCEPTNDETSSACSKVTDIGAEMLSVVDSTNDTLTVRWRGHQGMILQYREEGTNDPWQRTDRLTPDGTQEPATIVISNLNSVTTYEVRTLLPGQEEGRSARGEDLPTKGTTKPLNEHQESGFCVVLGKKIPSGEEIPSGSGTCSEQKCICQPGQPPMCRQRCSVPFFRRGAFSQDDLCTEKPSPEDACCVILQCTDQDAEGTGTDPCDQCSENTDCHKAAVQTDEALCMCKEGFVGDPYDKKSGCKPTAPLLATKELKKCFYKNNSYSMGQLFYDGCKQKCTCNNQAEIQCEPRCPKISEKMSEGCQMVTNPEDVCCKMIKCDDKSEKLTTGVTYTEQGTPVKGCVYKEKLYKKGQTFVDGCEKNCTCSQNGDVICKARCSPLEPNPSDKCVTVPDPSDICCTKILCDVGEESNESRNPPSSIEAEDAEVKGIDIDGVKAFNSSSARLIAHLPGNMTWQQGIPELAVFYTKDPNGHWSKAPVISTNPGVKSDLEIYASGLPSGKIYLRVENGALKSKDFSITLPDSPTGSTPGKECDHNGKIYKLNEEFHNGCEEYCACTKTGIQCATIECPTDFALDVLDPYCLDWEKEPGFVAVPPRCCPDMICKSNGTCHYKGESFDNYAEIPTKITGCEQRCYCEFGNVTCSPACPPVPATPPLTIGCDPSEARLSHLPGEDCCLYWLCPQPQGAGQKPPLANAPSNLPFPSVNTNEITLLPPMPLGPRAVRLIFQVPRVYIGLNGKVEVRYTDGSRDINDPSKWERAMTETDELIDGVQMAHEVSGLKPNTEYHFQIAIHVRELGSMVSHVAIVRTPHDVASAGPQVIPVDAGLAVSQVNATWIKVSWRKFSEDELQFIDGVQIRYRERGSQLFQSTPLIHRLVDSYLLEDLNPGTEYEINIIFVPFLGQDTELQAMRSVQATTGPPQADPYGFDLAVHVAMVKANSVELSWTGVPNPEDKYVNIFRAIYQSDVEANKHELSSTFKLAKRDSVSNRTRTVIQALKPNTRYRIWLEAYLTNGKVKRSDVRTFTTKPGLLPSAGASERVAEEPRGDYYGALVGVSVFAALAVVALVILMMIMVRRQHSVTANITSRGKSEAAFDNPSFKNSDEPAVVTNGSSKRTAQEDA
ncbi:uncharacterized protein LOC132192596 isoform X2 [Neocloeon triangulifer]|uniref:uncharacterized protein LOC132192596 isoform X2 n=1 Tax=Neocloeon triangulifer TaxID=2078957 RepID=UPI00286F3B7A|nr:uncharacterized protein LOC132192596 isoform X2 [Neocloeon triangulifer]